MNVKRWGWFLLAAVLLTGCSSEPAATSSQLLAAPPSAKTADQPTADLATAATTSPMGFLRPTPEQEVTLAAALVAIDPRLDNADRYIRRSVDQCDYVRKGEITGDALVASTLERFSGGSIPDLSTAQAQQILETIVATFCH